MFFQCALCMCIFVYHCFYFVYYCNCHTLGAALRALTEPCMSRSPIVHCHFMLHFYERINDDDDDMMKTIKTYILTNPPCQHLPMMLLENLRGLKLSTSSSQVATATDLSIDLLYLQSYS